jgi:GTPase SAR1 family protein
MWMCPVLYDLNASYNKLTHLPLLNACCTKETLESRGRTVSNPIVTQIKNISRSRRDEATKNPNQQRQRMLVNDHPLKSPIDEKPPLNFSTPNQQQQQQRSTVVLVKEKPIEKANFWPIHSIHSCMNIIENNDDLTNTDEKSSKTSTNKPKSAIESAIQRKESKLVELNLSNNKFSKIPECLSCLSPKLIKLNLSSNQIESMGAICDLPLSLKFLDLSNNLIKRPMRLLNESLLKFIIYYFTKYTSDLDAPQQTNDFLKINNILVNLLLENEFCYFNLVQKFLSTSNSRTGNNFNAVSPSARPQILPSNIRSKTRAPASQLNKSIPLELVTNESSPNTKLAVTSSNLRRRTRSQSRNQQKLIPNTGLSSSINTSSNRRALPFDLFLINLRYNRSYANQNETNFDMSNLIESLLSDKKTSLDHELDKKEKLILNSQNLQIFLEQLCPHKRHIKLENLKSLNLSGNKIKKCTLMFDLSSSLTQINANNISLILNQSPKSTSEMVTSESDFSESEDSLSSDDAFSSNDESLNKSKQEKKSSREKLKDKLSTLSSLKKKSEFTNAPNTSLKSTSKKKSLFYLSKSDEKATMIAKLMFPNLTHLDVSANRLKRLPGSISLLENLSYLNSSSSPYLVRVSPQIGLLTKLWNFDLKNCVKLRDPVSLNDLVKQRTKTSDILGFLKSILEHSRSYTRIKLMFVGVQAIGKTSLLNKLRDEGTYSSNLNRQSWSERSNQSTTTSNQSSILSAQVNISTVGIDINEWIYEKPKQKQSAALTQQQQQQQSIYMYQLDTSGANSTKSFGPITFRTWDFGGQREYYTTHQYFISKRALYLVCWKLSEEEKGINEIHHWLTNIQTRAPGSPVIIVGTHQDQLAKLKNYKEISNYLQRLIYERFVRPSSESETTSAYPPIMASIEISSKTGYNIKTLAKLVYDVATQMKSPGLKDQLLLEQKIPLTYLALEECISYVLQKLKTQSRNPVLNTANYLKEIRFAIDILYPDENDMQMGSLNVANEHLKSPLTSKKLKNKRLLIRFRDDAEILQATQFLHENGILIHYNDVALRDLFFLDPQWLCDILATVITIREINPFAAKGIMKIKDLLILFKGSRFTESEEIMSFIVDLLGKFELALTWDNEHLLIPSLLPSETMLKYSNQDIRISIVSKQKAYSDRQNSISYNNLVSNDRISTPQMPASASCVSFPVKPQTPQEQISSSLFSSVKLVNSYSQTTLANKLNLEFLYECKPFNSLKTQMNGLNATIQKQQVQMQNSIRRLYCLSYLPNGIFSRLITRILCDNILKDCLLDLIELEYCLYNSYRKLLPIRPGS